MILTPYPDVLPDALRFQNLAKTFSGKQMSRVGYKRQIWAFQKYVIQTQNLVITSIAR